MKQNRKRIISGLTIFVVLIAGFFISGIGQKVDSSRTYYFLGTVNQVDIFHEKKSKAEDELKKVNDILSDVHNKMSAQLDNTEVAKINSNAGLKPVKVSDRTFHVIEDALRFSKMSNGTFDVSIGAVSSLWAIGTDHARVPSPDEISQAVKLVNYKDIVLNDSDKTVFLKKKGMKIDLGAIAKGYAADLIADQLRKDGIKSAIINLGGNVYTLGSKAGRDFNIGIQDPGKKRNDAIGYITGKDISVVTSGIYERYITKNGKTYHHMLNPKTGYPFENNLNSVTIVSKKSIDGDGLSTTVFGLGLEDGKKLVESLGDADVIFITKDKKIYMDDRIKKNFVLLDKEYTVE